MAPIVGLAAVVDGTDLGLPDVPIKLLRRGAINRSPSGKPVRVILGTNRDEMALFLIAIPRVIPGVHLPFRVEDMARVADHLAAYHTHWGAAEAKRITDAYPRDAYSTGDMQIVRAGTDFCFACDTRNAARALAAAGIDTYLYVFEFEFEGYRDPASAACSLEDELDCGIYHGSDVGFVWQHRTSDARGAAVAAAIGGYWTTLAATGSPNGNDSLVQWPRYAAESGYKHIVFADVATVVDDDYRNVTCNFWDTMPKEAPYV